jgi:hypothetical protein
MYSVVPAPSERGFLAEFKIGKILTKSFKALKSAEKINSKIK